MNTVSDVRNRFRRMRFVNNAMLTMVLGFNYELPKVLSILATNGKNNKRVNYKTKVAYVNYLGS